MARLSCMHSKLQPQIIDYLYSYIYILYPSFHFTNVQCTNVVGKINEDILKHGTAGTKRQSNMHSREE